MTPIDFTESSDIDPSPTSALYRNAAEFVTADEQQALREWAYAMERHLRPNGPGRAFLQIDALPAPHPLWDRVRQRVVKTMALGQDPVTEGVIGHYLSIIASGGAVHRHKDASPAGTRHLRCNLFLQLPTDGGRPLLRNVAIDVAERALFCFYASETPHASEAVGGERKRIILSFGYTVPADHRLPSAP